MMPATSDNALREQGEVGAKKNTLSPQFSPIDRLLPLLARVKKTGPNTWLASCPTREDKRPSMTIRELGKPERRPFPAADVLRAIAFEALVVAVAGSSLLAGHPFTDADRARLVLAVGRIQAALTASGVNHG
jgi:hypothetical protein